MAGSLTKKQFEVLSVFNKENCDFTQRQLAERSGISLGAINSVVKNLTNDGLISKGQITDKGFMALQTYKVDNAIIMAAGMSSRFAPLSYEIPKGLLKVKGEILIERQIKQLQEAGITDITVVVGYMKERFFYLQEKFGVKLVVNEDYYRYNNPSTLLKVLDKIKNTYICSSDDYFTENVFEQYVYDAYYAAVFFHGQTDEWGLVTDKNGVINKVEHNVHDMWCMSGHAYFSKNFSEKFKEILLELYDKGDTKTELWEKLYERNVDKLKMYIRKYKAGVIYEFDSLQELREFDDKYLENTGSDIFKNICKVLHCRESEIQNIEVIKQGLTNLSFKFSVKDNEYVYRHPGIGTDDYISRKSEAFSMQIASELKLDNTFICMGNTGWKLSHYINNAHTLDYHNENEVKKALTLVKCLHDAGRKSKFNFDIWKKTNEFIRKIPEQKKNFDDFKILFDSMKELYNSRDVKSSAQVR